MEDFQIENTTNNITQKYKPEDINILNPIQINKEFGLDNDIIEMFIISPSGEILESNYNYKNFKNKNNLENSTLFNTIEINPEYDLISYGYDKGQFDILYNFNRLLFNSSNNNKFFIKEISSNRTEIKISSNDINYIELQSLYVEYIINRNQKEFYSDFILNFGNNKQIVGVNIVLDNNNIDTSSLFIKLYEPLPIEFNIKSQLWIAEVISDSYSYKLNKDLIINNNQFEFSLRGPNFNVELNDYVSTSTQYLNISNILDSSISSSYNNLQSIISNNIQINIDYNYFNNFIHFSSAKNRIDNFIFKLNQIQKIEGDIIILTNLSSSIESGSINNSLITLNNQINNITQNFDGYESFLYYESGSNSFPKQNNQKPYVNYDLNDVNVLNWLGSEDESSNYYGGVILDASNYDIQNRDYIWNNLPEYIKYDPQNNQLELITSMMGQHFDYIWTYIKDITNKNVADNRLNFGISKDLISETLKSFGIKLYTNSRSNGNIYSSILGINPDGTYLPTTGSYKIDNYISASNYTIPENDILKETQKRIYHNLPYLLKTRGTDKGIRALINCFGIPETILNVREFGGLQKDQNLIENKIEKFNYGIYFAPSSSIVIPFKPSYQQYINSGSTSTYPQNIEFRFKLYDVIPTHSIMESSNYFGVDKIIRVIDVDGVKANIDFGIKSGSKYVYSEPILLPLYNNNWWNVSLSKNNDIYELLVGNKNNNNLEYFESSSITTSG